jgi:hypothetical protein
MKKGKSYFNRLLVADGETTGLCFGGVDPSHNEIDRYQLVSLGLIVVDADTLLPLEKLYVELKWDGKSVWSDGAQRVHGLSKEYLEANGVSSQEAVELVADLILRHWGTLGPINICGNNPWFDKCFIVDMFANEGIVLKTAARLVDTNSIGFAVFGTYDSDELFSLITDGDRPVKHNALHDAEMALQVLSTVRQLSNVMLS